MAMSGTNAEGLNIYGVMDATGMTYRMIDYLDREGIVTPRLSPAKGTGNGSRLWGSEQLRILCFVAVLRAHGATHHTLIPAIRNVADLDYQIWRQQVIVTAAGDIVPLTTPGIHGWLVDLDECRQGSVVRQELAAVG
jgi:hypothetical protein